MKNITFSADERLIEKARERAAREHRNLNALFREWLERFTQGGNLGFDEIMRDLGYARAGRRFSRDEMNER
ncbi:MAG: hypothetical protein ABSF77_10035 [Spirochaetia bacterium]|jgi:hypothetical protein